MPTVNMIPPIMTTTRVPVRRGDRLTAKGLEAYILWPVPNQQGKRQDDDANEERIEGKGSTPPVRHHEIAGQRGKERAAKSNTAVSHGDHERPTVIEPPRHRRSQGDQKGAGATPNQQPI